MPPVDSAATGETYEITAINDARIFTAAANDTITMNLASGHLAASLGSCVADIEVTQWKITNAHTTQLIYLFTGDITGNGDIVFTYKTAKNITAIILAAICPILVLMLILRTVTEI